MKLSNLRLERNCKSLLIGGKPQARVVCDVSANYTDIRELYFCVDDEYADWLTSDVYDAFLVAAIYPCMYYNEPIEIEGCVTKKIYYNVIHFVESIVRDFAPSTHRLVDVKVQGFATAQKNKVLHVGTGFSGGVDSFSTLTDNFFNTDDPDYKIDTLFFFHLGQYGNVLNPKTWERAKKRYGITQRFAEEIGVNSVMLNTNLFDFYLPQWEYQAGVLCRIVAVLTFQRSLKRYCISNAYTYGEMIDLAHDRVFLEEFADPYLMPLLSPNGLDIVCDGAQYRRTTKTARISNNPLAQKYLNVCVNSSSEHVEATNCSICSKCMRTMMALDTLGVLDKFSAVFDLEKYEKRKFGYKCEQIYKYKTDGFARDNVDFAREYGKPLPPLFVAYAYHYSSWLCHLPLRIVRKLVKVLHLRK